MPAAIIEVNTVAGSDEGLPLNVLVQLSNQDVGDETSYLWSLIDRPEGSAAALSAAAIENPTITPDCEGTYVIQLVVDNGLPTQVTDVQILGVRELKQPDLRVPGATETTQVDAIKGWALRVNKAMKEYNARTADQGTFIGRNNHGGDLHRGEVVRVNATQTLKNGLPGQEDVPDFTLALATGDLTDIPLYVVERGVDGNATISNTALMRVRALGQFTAATGAGAVLNGRVWVSDAGILALTPGTFPRQVGIVQEAHAGDFDVQFVGDGGLGSAWEKMGNTVVVDAVFGSDALGQREGHPFATVGAALAVAVAGDTVLVRPGTYDLTAEVTVPAGVRVRGAGREITVLRRLLVVANTDLVTLGGSDAVLEGVRVYLTTATDVDVSAVVLAHTAGAKSARCIDVDARCDASASPGAAGKEVFAFETEFTAAGTALSELDENFVGCSGTAVGQPALGVSAGLATIGGGSVRARDSAFYGTGAGGTRNGVDARVSGTVWLLNTTLLGNDADFVTAGAAAVRLVPGRMASAAGQRLNMLLNPAAPQDAVNTRTWCGDNTLVVDPTHGTTAAAGAAKEGPPFSTLAEAIAAAASGDVIRLTAGTHTIAAVQTIPAGVRVQGAGRGVTVVQKLLVTVDTVLLTLQDDAVLADCTVRLTTAEDHNLYGVRFADDANRTARCERVFADLDASGAPGAAAVDTHAFSCIFTGAPASSVVNALDCLGIAAIPGAAVAGSSGRGLAVSGNGSFRDKGGLYLASGDAARIHGGEILAAGTLFLEGTVGSGGTPAFNATGAAVLACGPAVYYSGAASARRLSGMLATQAVQDAVRTDLWCGNNTLVVDPTFGDDALAAREGPPFATLEAAIAGAAAGDVIALRPGVHQVAAAFTIPASVGIVGPAASDNVARIEPSAAPGADYSLCTMGDFSFIRNVQLKLEPVTHHTFKGVVFPGVTAENAFLENVDVLVDNSAAGAGVSNVYAVHHTGAGTTLVDHAALRGCRLRVYSIGTGNKRALLADGGAGGAAEFRARDCAFWASGGTGSRVAVETNHANNTVLLFGGSTRGESSDVKRTLGALWLHGTRLETPAAGDLGFSAGARTLFQWAAAGAVGDDVTRYLRTLSYAAAGVVVALDNTCRLQNNGKGAAIRMTIRAGTAPAALHDATFTLFYKGVATPLTLALGAGNTTAYTVALSADLLDDLGEMAMEVVTSGGAGNNTSDVMVEVDVFYG